jgi:hypothetical protein
MFEADIGTGPTGAAATRVSAAARRNRAAIDHFGQVANVGGILRQLVRIFQRPIVRTTQIVGAAPPRGWF